jgi:polyhydroxyalkanoate synthase
MEYENVKLTFSDFMLKWTEFQIRYSQSLFQAWFVAIKSVSKIENSTGKQIQNTLRGNFDFELKTKLSEDEFSDKLSNFINSYSNLASKIDHNKLYRQLEILANYYDNLLEPLRDFVNRTPSEKISMKGRFEVHHYKTNSKKKFKTPILIVGSLINRHYILDLLPETSVIRHFQELGFDVYATDWRMPVIEDETMSLANYVHEYVENAVDKVEEITGSRKVTLFGYCWGGILSLMYSALYPKDVENLILHATPVDFSKSPTVLETWIKNFDVKNFVSVFGNVPSFFLNIAFWLRNPLEASSKYYFYFNQPRSLNEIKRFLAVEFWLYDSVPIFGKAFEQIIEDVYKKNLLIQNKMNLGGKKIDLTKISVPVLNIVGTKDDLVSADSSRTVTKIISSQNKKTIEFPTGHVGLCISKSAHKKLWPEVGEWLKENST